MQAARGYDTHKAVKKFIALGFSEKQSEGVVEEVKSLLEQMQGDLATKSDLQGVRFELKSDIQQVRAELKEHITNSNANTIKWMVSMNFATIGIVIGFLKFFH